MIAQVLVEAAESQKVRVKDARLEAEDGVNVLTSPAKEVAPVLVGAREDRASFLYVIKPESSHSSTFRGL